MSEKVQGIFKKTKKGGGELRSFKRSFRSSPQDIFVPAALVKKHNLVDGAEIAGPASGKPNNLKLDKVEAICGIDPEEYKSRKCYKDLTAVKPESRFNLEASGNQSMRIIDLVSPVGKGTRGLIVAPPKSGKTVLLSQICEGIRKDQPDAQIIVLLVDERPEEVTEFRREVDAEVLHSSLDNTSEEHIELVELTLAHIMTELECGRDVVVLVDSLTRMGRSFNLKGKGTGRTMSGGVEAGSLEIPRRFFGLARNIEDGGSVTIIATALVETGSKMDDLIFEEFKGTGNSEIVLDRKLAEARVWPAINLPESGTRNEEMLYGEEDTKRLAKLRKALSNRDTKAAAEALLNRLSKHPTNRRGFLDSIPV
ncbi:MAG: transcription termination factor Rho [Planctomycetota bacterium]|jgi:transcription termination factor Rho